MKKEEPTLREIMDTVADLTHAVQNGFQGVEKGMDRLAIRQTTFESRMDRVEVEMRGVSRRLGAIEEKTDEIQDTLESISKAVDKDAETVINHEERITMLEKVRA